MIVTEKWTNIYTHKVLEENKAVLHRKRQVRNQCQPKLQNQCQPKLQV